MKRSIMSRLILELGSRCLNLYSYDILFFARNISTRFISTNDICTLLNQRNTGVLLRPVPVESVIAQLPRVSHQLDTGMIYSLSVHSVMAQFYSQVTTLNSAMVA